MNIEQQETKFRFAPPTTVKDLLGRSSLETKGLGLYDAAIHIGVRSRPRLGLDEYMAVIDSGLYGDDLNNFLLSVAPNKGGFQRRSGTIADLQMPDLINPEDRGLEILHRALGRVWDIHELSRPPILSALRVNPVEVCPLTTDDVRRQNDDFFLTRVVYGHLGELIKLVTSEAMGEFRGRLIKTVKESPKSAKKSYWNITDSQLAEKFWSWGAKKRIKALKLAFTRSDEDTKNAVADFCREQIKGNDYRIKLIEHRNYDTQHRYLEAKAKPDNTAEVRDTNWYLTFQIQRDEKGKIIGINPSFAHPNHFVKPLLRWTINQEGTKRDWILEPFGVASSSEVSWLVQPDSLPIPRDIKRLNPLVGLLSAAYFSPDLTSHWPTEMSLPGSNKEQMLGGAQVGLLAVIRRNDLAGADLLLASEQYAKSCAA